MQDCPYTSDCRNFNKSCFKCFNYNMYRPHKEYKRLQPKSVNRKEKKQGMEFEKEGAKKYNQAVHFAKDIAHRQLASGAFSFALGDMITEEELTAALAEFKERGSVNAKGEKYITIHKKWLDKLKEEAKLMGRDYYFLPFRFKDGDKDYVVLEYDLLLSYVQTIQMLVEQIKLFQKQLSV
jgi:hypothetical protein